MGALRDPKLEAFARHLLSNLVAGMARSKAAHEAGITAGYRGNSLAANSRKRAQRKDVKARMAELAAPKVAQDDEQLEATVDWAERRLVSIASPDLGSEDLKALDQIAALKLLAQIKGWMAPEKRDVTLRPTHQMTDDELARIAAGSGPGAATST